MLPSAAVPFAPVSWTTMAMLFDGGEIIFSSQTNFALNGAKSNSSAAVKLVSPNGKNWAKSQLPL